MSDLSKVVGKVAVVGAGIFGCLISLELSRKGFSVKLFEEDKTILNRTSRNNCLRMHRGFHYPRHLSTALQSIRGYNLFIDSYGEFLNHNFDHYYVVATDSKTSSEVFRDFISRIEQKATQVDLIQLERVGIRSTQVASAWQVSEPVLDLQAFRVQILQELAEAQVELLLGREVLESKKSGEKWIVSTRREELEFDYVFIATHSSHSFPISNSSHVIDFPEQEFHLTQVLVAHVNQPDPFGLTVIDGDYITILPTGSSNEISIYAPTPSRIRVATSERRPFKVADLTQLELADSQSQILERFSFWVPGLRIFSLEPPWIALRRVPAHSKTTDRRDSELIGLAPGLFGVMGTKLDHAIEISRLASELLTSSD